MHLENRFTVSFSHPNFLLHGTPKSQDHLERIPMPSESILTIIQVISIKFGLLQRANYC